MKIKIILQDSELSAVLYDTPTAKKIIAALPISGRVNRWGDEIYFSIPIHIEMEPHARDVLEPGELAFWPPGKAFCIFWGPTPASTGNEPRAASDVNVFGKVQGDASILDDIRSGSDIRIEALKHQEDV